MLGTPNASREQVKNGRRIEIEGTNVAKKAIETMRAKNASDTKDGRPGEQREKNGAKSKSTDTRPLPNASDMEATNYPIESNGYKNVRAAKDPKENAKHTALARATSKRQDHCRKQVTHRSPRMQVKARVTRMQVKPRTPRERV